ncbi:MAG: cadherin repeat domain-containing protein, partial [Rhizobiaceae bacterium]|nr:cadherin repeat domain-containing protein [Rhizobiaceae bacterium]
MATTSFTNSTGITLDDYDQVTQSVVVSGIDSEDFSISVTLTDYTTGSPGDLNLMLVAPDNETAFVFWSNVGSADDISNFTVTISDDGTVRLPDVNQPLVNGLSYLPTDTVYEGAAFADFSGEITYAPFRGSGSFNSVFGDINPNGTWTLYALDNVDFDSTSLASWTLTFTSDDPPSAPVDTDGKAGGSVAEDAAIGAAVGITASAADPDSSPLTYRLTNDAGGLFAIDAQTG